MKFRILIPLLLGPLLAVARGESGASAEDLEFFEKKIRPVLAEHCYECHSVKANKLKGDLLLDSRNSILRGGDTGPAIELGKPEASLLIETVGYANVDLQMPPKYRLDAEIVDDLAEWVRRGAPWPDEPEPDADSVRESFDLEKRRAEHWCWQPVAKPEVPEVKVSDWPLSELDHFILHRLEQEGLRPAPDADRRTWIRRVSFDLRGIPPTWDEVETFVKDESPQAHETVVDRYLSSPDYGVKWGRHWLDLARYAESYGHEFDYDIPHAWKYRDYVVRAFQQDVPHDQMILEAVAGDLLESPRLNSETKTNESVVGTGFWWLGEATHAPTDVRGDEALRIDNQIDTLSKSFLGLTVSCARCHDHKFDAISDEDYYSLTGYLQSSRRELVPRDPAGRIAEGVTELRELQQQASSRLPVKQESTPSGEKAEALWDFAEGLSEGWIRSGEAFAPEPTQRPEVALLPGESSSLPPGVWHSGIYGRKLHGVLRSPAFVLEKPELHLHLAAEGKVRVRAVVDGYFMDEFNALLFKGMILKDGALQTGGKWQWKRLGGDLRKYVGHRMYLEFLDEGDGYLAVDQVSYQPGAPAPSGVPLPTGELEPLLGQAGPLQSKIPDPDYVLGMTEGTPEEDRLHIRGGHKSLGEELPRRFLTALGGQPGQAPDDASGRLDLAKRMVAEDNPLTARVQVNRIWHHLTGRGLVPTVDDFGVMGEEPSHPELLDWMARRFMELGWSNRQMIREVVLSRTYRMACRPDESLSADLLAEKDPSNDLLHAFRVRRLTSESIRDGILAVSGRLDPKIGGPPVPVHVTPFMEGRGKPAKGPLDGQGRRSLYTAVRRNFLPPFHLAFDFPQPFSTMGRRANSNVPAQSLVLLNDEFVSQQAGLWAKKLIGIPGSPDRIRMAFHDAFSREPSDTELETLEGFLAEQASLHGAGPDDPALWSDLCHLLFNKKEFIFLR